MGSYKTTEEKKVHVKISIFHSYKTFFSKLGHFLRLFVAWSHLIMREQLCHKRGSLKEGTKEAACDFDLVRVHLAWVGGQN